MIKILSDTASCVGSDGIMPLCCEKRQTCMMEMPQLEPCIPVPMDEKIFNPLVDKAKDWALMHGAAMRSKANFSPDSLNFAPFTLFPSTFPRAEFLRAVNIQTILNELIHKVAHDYEFLSESLSSTIEVDGFTKKLFELYETMRKEGVTQHTSLGLVRSDIMLETACALEDRGCQCENCGHQKHTILEPDMKKRKPRSFCCWKQVEINTIASGFGHLGPMSSAIHRFVFRELGRFDLLKQLPDNDALSGLCSGMLEAWRLYNQPQAAILFIIEDVSYNICDQRFHEFKLAELEPTVRVHRRTLTQVEAQGKLTAGNRLFVDDFEVAVVYFRCGYEPAQYHGEAEWAARLLIERSLAIKCPSIHYHLAGTKKVQQALARPNALERFLKDPQKVEAVREIFTGLYSLDFDSFGDEAAERAMTEPERFVLKPQREGGGNNVYGADVKTKMEEMKSSKDRTAWILMDKIVPPVQQSYIIRPGVLSKSDMLQQVVSELGIFGVILGDSEKILLNRQVGHMLRTKQSSANEGGVAAGAGCLDSPFLVD